MKKKNHAHKKKSKKKKKNSCLVKPQKRKIKIKEKKKSKTKESISMPKKAIKKIIKNKFGQIQFWRDREENTQASPIFHHLLLFNKIPIKSIFSQLFCPLFSMLPISPQPNGPFESNSYLYMKYLFSMNIFLKFPLWSPKIRAKWGLIANWLMLKKKKVWLMILGS